MKSEPPIAHHCHVLADGTVIPDPGYEGPLTVQGPFRGPCLFSWLPARGTEPHTIIAQRRRQPATSERAELIGVDYRDMLYFWLEYETVDGYFNCSMTWKPTVGGAYPSIMHQGDYPTGATEVSVDPSTVITDASYGWPIDPDLEPYVLGGRTVFVEGDVGLGVTPGLNGYEDLPSPEVLAVGSMRDFAQTIGGHDYEWRVCDVFVREYKYQTYTWAEWWAI